MNAQRLKLCLWQSDLDNGFAVPATSMRPERYRLWLGVWPMHWLPKRNRQYRYHRGWYRGDDSPPDNRRSWTEYPKLTNWVCQLPIPWRRP